MRHIFNASLLILLLIGSRAFALDYSPLVINEVDYNQSEYNKSAQFVEFKNTTTRSLSLAGYALELYDTANLPVDFEHPKMTLNLSADVTLEPGGYYVICRSQAVSSLSSAECDRFAPNDMVILPWDGPRGGLRLVFGEGENMEVVDSLSWGQYVEGLTEGTTPARWTRQPRRIMPFQGFRTGLIPAKTALISSGSARRPEGRTLPRANVPACR